MSDVLDMSDLEGLAGEYVLGTLTADERTAVERLAAQSPLLAAHIASFETRLSPLIEPIAPVAPSPAVWQNISQHIANQPQAKNDNRKDAGKFWQPLAVAASFIAAISLGTNVYLLQQTIKPLPVADTKIESPTLALLHADDTAPAFLINLNKDNTLTVYIRGGTLPADKSYQLWVIAASSKTPQSLGVIGKDVSLIALKDVDANTLRSATLAVSLEPEGGSPTGLPTGPVISTGTMLGL